jgi:hypothetical protein
VGRDSSREVRYVHEEEAPRRGARHPLDELFECLRERIPSSKAGTPHPDIATYIAEQRSTFGDDRVWVFCARTWRRQPAKRRRGEYLSLAVFAAGTVWAVASQIMDDAARSVWLTIGLLTAVFGLLFCVVSFAGRKRSTLPRKLAGSTIVISPVGLAMIQDDVRGKVRWDEITRVHSGIPPGKIVLDHSPAGLFVHFAGSMIVVRNIYDAPLAEIESLIQRHRSN